MSVKELTGDSLTDLWKEYQSSFRDFWQVSDDGVMKLRKAFLEQVSVFIFRRSGLKGEDRDRGEEKVCACSLWDKDRW